MRAPASLATALAVLTLAACGAPAPTTTQRSVTSSAIVDPAALYCQGTGGTVIHRTSGGRRADLCRMSDGRTVSAAELLNSHNDL
ncbi:DUF333 domain-containing protein [Paracoccus sanguinis]|uniref:Hemolysin n=1 Tax=Paracoccus sanguinis TaxID=1545044 RepID=A0A099GLD7_9RHOB|nr:DUF333 domain-containing protein [Paracoccus sanguinis]KGJ15434.1 hypothetical protein IX54_01805 [Paracoccus sanguinis]KGJ23665.1 hypothetical protein IX56_00805 [Paracoccus sanguinis]